MATYVLSSTASDLSGGADYNGSLVTSGAGTAGFSFSVAANTTETSYGFTPSGVPGIAGINGTYTVEVNITTGSTNGRLSISLSRVNSSGAVQAGGTATAEQTASAGAKAFSVDGSGLGTWASGDRLRVNYIWRNVSTMSSISLAISTGTTTSEVIEPIKASNFTEDWSGGSIDAGKWTQNNSANTSAAVTNGELHQTVSTSAQGWASIESVSAFDLVGSHLFVKLVQTLQQASSGAETEFAAYNTSGSGSIRFLIKSDGGMEANYFNASNTYTWLAGGTYSASTHTWLRFKEASGTTYWQTAPSTASNPPQESDWVTYHSMSTSSLGWTPNAIRVHAHAGNNSALATAPTGPAIWDGFNTATTSASAVGADSAQSYAIVAAVGADGAGSYAVVASVGQDSAGSYAIVESAGQDQAGTYAVVAAVGADHAGAYGVGGTVSADAEGSYAIHEAVGQDCAGSYAVVNAAGQDQAGAYAVIEAVGQDHAGSYGIAGVIGQDSAGSYAVVAAVGQDSAQSYGVVAAVGQDCAGSYAIEAVGVVGSNLDGAYAVLGAVGQDHAGTYSVVEIVGGDQAGAYAVLESAGQDQAGAYSIVHAVGQEQAGTYGIAGAVGQDIAGSYGITATVTSDSVGQYQVLATVAADGAGTYAVLEAAGADLTQVYALIAQVAADLAGGYAVESVPLSPFAALEARINRAMFAHLSDTEATLDGVAVTGMFEDGYARGSVGVIGMAATQPVFVMPTADIGGESVGLLLVVGSTTYVVGSHEPDGTGVSRLLLELAA